MTEIVKDEKQFSVEVVNRLVTQKMITFNDEEKKYVITKEGKKFRKYMLENSGIDIDEKQIAQIKYCKDKGQSINLGLTKIQAEILLGKPVSKEELVNDNREGY